jgi:rhodanese-related sulfurtransferase
MAMTFSQMVAEAQSVVAGIDPKELRRRAAERPETLVVDVRDLADRRASGMVEGAVAISAGTIPFKADLEVPVEWRDPRLQDRATPVVTVCDLGPMSALAAKTLKEMGFADVAYLEGGVVAWAEAGGATVPPTDA